MHGQIGGGFNCAVSAAVFWCLAVLAACLCWLHIFTEHVAPPTQAKPNCRTSSRASASAFVPEKMRKMSKQHEDNRSTVAPKKHRNTKEITLSHHHSRWPTRVGPNDAAANACNDGRHRKQLVICAGTGGVCRAIACDATAGRGWSDEHHSRRLQAALGFRVIRTTISAGISGCMPRFLSPSVGCVEFLV